MSSEPGARAPPPRQTNEEYLQEVERLAKVVTAEAFEEGWLIYLTDNEEQKQTPLQAAVNELAQNLRHVHYDGDGCLEAWADEDD